MREEEFHVYLRVFKRNSPLVLKLVKEDAQLQEDINKAESKLKKLYFIAIANLKEGTDKNASFPLSMVFTRTQTLLNEIISELAKEIELLLGQHLVSITSR